MGRFMVPDNISGNMANPQSWNLYSYVHGNPVNFNDPTGHYAGGAGDSNIFSAVNSTGAEWDGGQDPSIGLMLPHEFSGTIGSSMPTSVLMHSLGFSDAAISRAQQSGQGLNPQISLYTVHSNGSDLPHSAVGATLGGETLFLSRWGDFKEVISTEKAFIEHYNSEGDSVTVSRLKGDQAQNIISAVAIRATIAASDHGDLPGYMYCSGAAAVALNAAYGRGIFLAGISPEHLKAYVDAIRLVSSETTIRPQQYPWYLKPGIPLGQW